MGRGDPLHAPLDDIAVDRLAQRLCYTMQRRNPEPEGDWAELNDAEREYLRGLVRDLLENRKPVATALGTYQRKRPATT